MITQWKRQTDSWNRSDRVPGELWMELRDIVQEAVIQTIPKKKAKRQNGCLRGLKNSYENKRSERQRRKERYTHLNEEFQRIARRFRKAFLSDQCKEIEKNSRMGKTLQEN